jgi:nicotinamide riboside kinase
VAWAAREELKTPMQVTKIALTGAHGVGKTTLANELCRRLDSSSLGSVSMTPEVPRVICSFANDPTFFRRGKNNSLKQALLLYGQLQYEQFSSPKTNGVLICDRSVLDHWAYTKYFFADEFTSAGVLDLFEALVASYCQSYDRLFYVPIEFPPVDDGTRESDAAFQSAIDFTISAFLETHKIPHIRVAGTVTGRFSSVEAELKVLQQVKGSPL